MTEAKDLGRPYKSAQIANDIEQTILTGGYLVGARLPSETELCKRYEVSRTVIREALKRLNASGLVRTVNGSGSFVNAMTMTQLQSSIQRYTAMIEPVHGYLELLDLRLMIESGAARLLAETGHRSRTMPVAAKLDEMRRLQDDIPKFADADISFHMAIVAATENSLLIAVHTALEPMMRRLGREMYRDTRKTSGLFEEHEQIFHAIVRRDAEGAFSAMRAHLTASKAQWIQMNAAALKK
jgi:GntR family transcriptional regulator, transcriptional repressor for pyruvate dehydrogenase complex